MIIGDGVIWCAKARVPSASLIFSPGQPSAAHSNRRISATTCGLSWLDRAPGDLREVVGDAVRIAHPHGSETGAKWTERPIDLHAARLRAGVDGFDVADHVLNAGAALDHGEALPKRPHVDR